MLGLYFGDYTPSAMIPIAASSREQAEIMYRQAEGLVARSPELRPASARTTVTGGSSACGPAGVSRSSPRTIGRATASSRAASRWSMSSTATVI
jgi:hypothetical protein